MDPRKIVLHETLVIAVGTVLCAAVMVGIYALLGFLDRTVVLGALIGSVLSIANFFIMAVSTNLAADKAQEQDVSAGKKLVQGSYMIRLLAIFGILFVFAKTGLCDPLALVLPLAFVRPVITVYEFFRKKEDKKA